MTHLKKKDKSIIIVILLNIKSSITVTAHGIYFVNDEIKVLHL